MRSIVNLLGYLRPYRSLVAFSIISNILLSIFTVVSIPLIIPFFQLLFDQAPLTTVRPENYNPAQWVEYGFSNLLENNDKTQALLYVCTAIIVVFFFKNLFRYLSLYFMAPVRNGIVRDLRSKLYLSYSDMPVAYINEAKKGDLISRATNDVHEVEWSILNVLEVIFKAPLIIIGSIILMIFISPGLSLFVLVLILFTMIIIGGIGKTLKKSSSLAQRYLGEVTSTIEESITGHKIIRVFNAGEFFFKRFNRLNTKFMHIINKVLRRRDMSSPLTEFLGVAVVVVLLFYGSRLVFDGALSAEYFFAFIFAFYQVIEPSKTLSSAYYNIQKGVAALERIEEVGMEIHDKEGSPRRPFEQFVQSIRFEGVCFSYPGTSEMVLEDLSFEIRKGEKVGIVGASGAGKTTIIELLLGYYRVTGGRITIDGINIDDISRVDLYKLFGLVSQKPFLFNDSIRNNVVMGSNASTENVKKAIRIAQIEEFVDQLPDGIDSNIGDSGVKLSGGQRQRITIARALLKDAPVTIFDEASSELDTEKEVLIKNALIEFGEDKTLLIIAHRFTTIKDVDRIIVLKNGKITEIGTHGELTAQEGDYSKYVYMQNQLG